MVKRIERVSGVVAPREEVERKGVLADLRKKFRGKLGAVFASMAILAVSNETEAETGNTDNIQYVGDINDPTINGRVYADFSDASNRRLVESGPFGSGEIVEIDSRYSLQVKLGSNGKVLDILDNPTGAVLESITFTGDIRDAVPLGNGYIAVNAQNSGNNLYVFNTSEIGSPQGVYPVESSYSQIVALVPLYMIPHPTSGDVVGVAFSDGSAFMFHLGDFVDNPDPNHQVKENIAYQTIGLSDPNYNGAYGAVDKDGNCHIVSSRTTGEKHYYINPAASGVEAPVELPEIQAPASLELNLGNIGSELLEVEVSNVPENGKVVMNIGGIQFELLSLGNEKYEKRFDLNELIGIEKGEFDMTGVVKVLDESGDVVKDENDVEINAEVVMSVDLVAPAKVDFEIEGAVDGVLEVEEVPATAVVEIKDVGDNISNLFAVSVEVLPDVTRVEFEGMLEEEKRGFVEDLFKIKKVGDEISIQAVEGAKVMEVDLEAEYVEMALPESDVVVFLISTDAAGNFMTNAKGVTVVTKHGESMDMGRNEDMDVAMDGQVDMSEDMETGKVDMGREVDSGNNASEPEKGSDGGGETGGCSVAVSANEKTPGKSGGFVFMMFALWAAFSRRGKIKIRNRYQV
jgi:hypothetical protein